ncbi:MAG TPA: M1 family metallopeptidase [Kofleriaceae bacterium]|nr:M1 family metallopeptidase [Kofleriaceae bacterium]
MKKLPKADGSPALRGGGAPRSPQIASYNIDARLDAVRHQVTGKETLVWMNTGQSAVDVLPFHLYLNAFKNEQSIFMKASKGEMRGAKASDTGWGWIEITSLKIGGAEQVAKLRYPNLPDETVVELPLAEPVQPGSSIEIAIEFTDQLPEVFARTGYKGDFHLVGQWFPKIGVRVSAPSGDRWECQPLHINTEFFADFGKYDVALTVPSTHVVAATGVLVKAADLGGQMRQYTYHAEDVHDFVWMADPYMEIDKNTGRTPYIGQAKVDDGIVEVRVYARPEQAQFARRHLQAAIGAIEKFSNYFVPYPWPIMTVIDPPVDAADGAGGMEYPTLVTTAGDSVFTRPGVRIPEYVTVHEVGHNWFQGILASNEPVEAWLDEGMNEWADLHVMQDLYGPRANGIEWGGWQADIGWMREAIAGGDFDNLPSPIATAAYAFVDNKAYGQGTYAGTMAVMTTLEKLVGSTKFLAAMKAYAKEWAFKHPTGRDLFAVLERELGMDLGWYFGPTFEQVGGHKLEVRTADCDKVHEARGVFGEGPGRKTKTEDQAPDTGTYQCEVIVQNTGVVHVPVEVEFKFADGSTQRETWDDRGNGNWKRWVIERSSKLVEVRLDPDRKIMFGNPVTDQLRIDGDGSASLRAAARIASWTQGFMQLVGP